MQKEFPHNRLCYFKDNRNTVMSLPDIQIPVPGICDDVVTLELEVNLQSPIALNIVVTNETNNETPLDAVIKNTTVNAPEKPRVWGGQSDFMETGQRNKSDFNKCVDFGLDEKIKLHLSKYSLHQFTEVKEQFINSHFTKSAASTEFVRQTDLSTSTAVKGLIDKYKVCEKSEKDMHLSYLIADFTRIICYNGD